MVKKFDFRMFLSKNIVPIILVVITAIMMPFCGFSGGYLIQEVVIRLSRETFLVLSLLIPIIAGMGINFGLALGTCAGRIALILVVNWHISGAPGMLLAMLISLPISILLGLFSGYLLNNTKGREMITTMVLSFFIVSLYQIIVLFGMGKIIPISDETILLPRGYGIRDTIPLDRVAGSFDKLIDQLTGLRIQIAYIDIPLFTILVVALLCFLTCWFGRTKLGQEIRAVGQDMGVSATFGINVNKTRIISMIISTVLAGFGQLIYLQNIGVMPVYTGADTVAFYAVFALLAGGATARKAGIPRVILGTVLFNLVIICGPTAIVRIFGMSTVAEYFRLVFSYSVITLALIKNAWNTNKERYPANCGYRKRSANPY